MKIAILLLAVSLSGCTQIELAQEQARIRQAIVKACKDSGGLPLYRTEQKAPPFYYGCAERHNFSSPEIPERR